MRSRSAQAVKSADFGRLHVVKRCGMPAGLTSGNGRMDLHRKVELGRPVTLSRDVLF